MASLKRQLRKAIFEQTRFGESKHEAKKAAKVEAQAKGERWNPARVDGIFSIGTAASYAKQAKYFANWVEEKHGKGITMAEAKKYVSEFLEEGVRKGLSPWTLQLQRSALRKVFNDPKLAEEVKLPIRHRDSVKRSRLEVESDKKFSEAKNKDFVDFARATGLRRHELAALTKEDVLEDGTVIVRQGKGGKSRYVKPLENFKHRIIEIAKKTPPGEKIFNNIPVRADVHSYRREYSQKKYQELTGQKLETTVKKNDPVALRKVSQNLGHNRIDVVPRSYA